MNAPVGYPAAAAAIAMMAIVSCQAIADEVRTVGWAELPDASAQEFEDPYRDLAPQQMSDLMSLVGLREVLADEALGIKERERLEARATELEAALQAAGIDVDWLISQRWVVADRRRQAAVAINRSLDGQLVEIAGFLISTPPGEGGQFTGYLVPDRGMCSHLPPPPPNQLLRLVMEDVPEMVGVCTPAAARGTLLAEETRGEAFVIDDMVPMWSAWTLDTVDVSAVSSPAAKKSSLR